MEARALILTISPATWCDQAAAMLATTIRGAPCYTVGDMRAEIAAGGAKLYSVTADTGELVGYVVMKIEHYEGGAEGVIVAGAGRLMGARLFREVLPALERMFTGVRSIRVDACRGGSLRELMRQGYKPTHAIVRKTVLELRGDDVLEELQGANLEARGGPDLRARPGKLHGGGGGSSRSDSTSTQTTSNADRRIVADGGSTALSTDNSTVTINTLDAGAIQNAFKFASDNQQETGKTLQSVLGVAADVFTKAAASVDSSAAVVSKAYDNAQGQGDTKTYIAAAALAVVAVVAVRAFAK